MAIKPIMTGFYNISEYVGLEHELALAFIKTKGIILITHTKGKYWFYAISTDSDIEVYDIIESEGFLEEKLDELLNNILKPYAESFDTKLASEKWKKPNRLKSKILEKFRGDLENSYENNLYVGVGDYKDEFMKRLVLNPIETFDMFNINKKDYELTNKEGEAIKKEFKRKASELVEFYNSHSGDSVVIYDKNGNLKNKSDLFKTEDFFKTMFNLVDKTLPSYIFSLKYKSSEFSKTEAGKELADVIGFKRVLKDKSVESYYYYDENLKCYETTTKEHLKNIIDNYYGFNISFPNIKRIFEDFPNNDKLNNNILVFNNILYDIKTLEPLDKSIDRKKYFSVKKIGYKKHGEERLNLINYDLSLKFEDINQVKDLNDEKVLEEMTLTEKTLRQILIPKNNPEDLDLFIDFLERTGAKTEGRNLFKTITYYVTDIPNTGKSALNLTNDLLYNDLNLAINPSTFDDKHFFKQFIDKLAMNIDEIDEKSFENVKPQLKQVSSQYSKLQFRGMYNDNLINLEYFPELTIYSNVKLKLDPVEDLAMFERTDFLELPNRFVSEKELSKYPNAYLKDDELFDKLRKDKDGLSWLMTASLLAYKKMKEEGRSYTCKQTLEESIDVYLDTNYIYKFLSVYTEELPDDTYVTDYTYGKDIKEAYVNYMDLKGIELSEYEKENKLSAEIGKEIANLYHFKKDDHRKNRGSEGYRYAIRLKSFDELATEYKQIYQINEDSGEAIDNFYKYASGDEKTVYRNIKTGTNNTINKLKEAYPDCNIPKIIKELENKNLIYNTANISLTERY